MTSSILPEVCWVPTESLNLHQVCLIKKNMPNKPNLVPAPPRAAPSSRCSYLPPCWKKGCSVNSQKMGMSKHKEPRTWARVFLSNMSSSIFENLTGMGVLSLSMFPNQSPTFHFLQPIGSGSLSATFLRMEVSPWKYGNELYIVYPLVFFLA